MTSTVAHRRSDPYLSPGGVPIKRPAETLGKPRSESYLMENPEECIRLELKTDPEAVRKQATWCGLKAGFRVLDVGCGSGKTTSILHQMIQPGGSIMGIDASEDRISYAKEHYGQEPGIDFQVHDFQAPLNGLGQFDLVWARFVLEYFRQEGLEVVRNLTNCLRPGGFLCLLDLDNNCLSHYSLSPKMEKIFRDTMAFLEENHNFDPYAGRRLYAYLYDSGYEDIQVELMAHNLIYGKLAHSDAFNWSKKLEMASTKAREILEVYPGGTAAFVADFSTFLSTPRRFTYSPLILCKGKRPRSKGNM
jgi:2-polyprenyl-3-methyl-5-hydroxy-6-metoxy-1,4-benzoquinol methylase